MSNESKKEYLSALQSRYETSSKKEKKKILDEFSQTCLYNRKYAIRNELYENEWTYLFNFFIPSVKLVSKHRSGIKQYRKYDAPKTPLQRLLETQGITKKKRLELLNHFKHINPFKLQDIIVMKIKKILKYAQKESG